MQTPRQPPHGRKKNAANADCSICTHTHSLRPLSSMQVDLAFRHHQATSPGGPFIILPFHHRTGTHGERERGGGGDLVVGRDDQAVMR